jgi:hypothetical protein
MENNRENIKEKYKYYKDPKDVCIGIIFIFIGFFFFVIMSFWIIFSKLNKLNQREIQKMPKIIQFMIYDKHYCFVIIVFLPVLIVLFYFRRMAGLYFRHRF